MILTNAIEKNYLQQEERIFSCNLLYLVLRYFKWEQHIGLFLSITGFVAFVSGLYFTIYKQHISDWAGLGVGLIVSGWLTIVNGILISLRSQWNCFAACSRLREPDIFLVDNRSDYIDYRLQRAERVNNWLAILFILLLLCLQFSKGLFWQGCIQAALWMNSFNLLIMEFRSSEFSKYWKKVLLELERYDNNKRATSTQ
jgi:hypothetical protein